MAIAYWMTFRIHDDAGRDARHSKLVDVMREVCTGAIWSDADNFVAFDSTFYIDEMTAMVKRAIDPAKDFALISLISIPAHRLVGTASREAVAHFFPQVEKV